MSVSIDDIKVSELTVGGLKKLIKQVIEEMLEERIEKIPNETTRETFEKTDRGEELIECKDADDLFKKLEI